MMKYYSLSFILCLYFSLLSTASAAGTAQSEASAETPVEPAELIRKAMDHWRGRTSYSEMTMTIHRPDWQRSMSMRSWTKGDKTTLVRITRPGKDAGSATLTKDNNMWTYAPKINRIIKVPSSMMSQSWMGSDFSNKDISKSTDIIDQYDHQLLDIREQDGHRVYIIKSVPHEDAAVVWGSEVLTIRDDYVLLSQEFIDQDKQPVKIMKTLEISEFDGRSVASRIRMAKKEARDEWTEITIQAIRFDLDIPDSLFTLSSLRNPRQ